MAPRTTSRLLVRDHEIRLIRRMEFEQTDVEGALRHQRLQRLLGQEA